MNQRNFIFIVGCGHSGTSLMLRILNEHPGINSVPHESRVMLKRWPKFLTKLYLNSFRKNVQYVCEKTPKHITKIQKIKSYFPEAKILLMTRNGLDNIASLKKRNLNFDKSYNRWIGDNGSYLKSQYKEEILQVKLEDLTDKKEEVMERVLKYLNLEYKNLLNYHEKKVDWYSNTTIDDKPKSEVKGKDHDDLRNYQINSKLKEKYDPIFEKTLSKDEIEHLLEDDSFNYLTKSLHY